MPPRDLYFRAFGSCPHGDTTPLLTFDTYPLDPMQKAKPEEAFSHPTRENPNHLGKNPLILKMKERIPIAYISIEMMISL